MRDDIGYRESVVSVSRALRNTSGYQQEQV